MRKILFKAKKLSDGEWVKGSLVKTPFGTFIEWYEDSICNKREVDPLTVCQFTGLKDCKGNEIWEHDLIHFLGYKPIGEVIWSEEDYAFMVAASEYEPLYLLPHVLEIGKIERVGNKFDKEK